MKNCPTCKIKVGASFSYCPLCQNELIELDELKEVPFFPENKDVRSIKRKKVGFQIQLFVVTLICILCFALDYLFDIGGTYRWSPMVLIAALSAEMIVINFMQRKKGLAAHISRIAFFVALPVLLIFNYFGQISFALEYIFPIIVLITLLINTVLALFEITGNTLAYALVNIAIAIIPWIVYYTKYHFASIPWNITFVAGVIALFALLIFRGGKVIGEFQKRLNV